VEIQLRKRRNGRVGIHGFLSGPVSSAVIAEDRTTIRTSRKSLGLNAEDILIKDEVSWVLKFFKMQSEMIVLVKDTTFPTSHPCVI